MERHVLINGNLGTQGLYMKLEAFYYFPPTHSKPVVQLFLFTLVIWEN